MDTVKPSHVGEVLRHFDDLLEEAQHLRERIVSALQREREPFFPDRRYHDEPHKPDRRKSK
jgi:hypothetical protein